MFPIVDPALVTDWFGFDQNPVHVGAYQCCENEIQAETWHTHGYRYWDGKNWGFYNSSPHMAKLEQYRPSLERDQKVLWRGLKEKPV